MTIVLHRKCVRTIKSAGHDLYAMIAHSNRVVLTKRYLRMETIGAACSIHTAVARSQLRSTWSVCNIHARLYGIISLTRFHWVIVIATRNCLPAVAHGPRVLCARLCLCRHRFGCNPTASTNSVTAWLWPHNQFIYDYFNCPLMAKFKCWRRGWSRMLGMCR